MHNEYFCPLCKLTSRGSNGNCDYCENGVLFEDVVKTEHKSILTEAEGLVHGDRNKDYGPPIEDFTRSAKMWSAILGIEVRPDQIPLCMIAVKLSRECNRPKRDNMVDIAGYAETCEWTKADMEKYEKK